MAPKLPTTELLSLDSAGLQRKLDAGLLTSVELVQACLEQIDKHDRRGAKLNAMVSLVPKHILMERSVQLDRERTAGRVRSQFHGIPILIKDAIVTPSSLELATTLGSLAFKDSMPPKIASIVARLEEMAAIVLGKTDLNEFCDFKGDGNSNGWSAIGGQTQSAYLAHKANETRLGQTDPCGSSTGSAVGVSAGYAPLSLGTESIGSIVMPGARAGLYALNPTLGTVSMDGVFKSSVELDVVGGLARSTTDLALLSRICLTEENRDLLPTEGYLKFLTKKFDSLRIGFLNPTKWSLHPNIVKLDDVILKQMNDIYFAAIERIRKHTTQGSVVYPVDIPPATDLWYEGENPIDIIMSYEGKQAVESWLDEVKVPCLETIEDIIKFNFDHHEMELPESHSDQNQLLKASWDPPSKEVYETVKERMKLISKDNGIDKLFRERNLNMLAFPLDSLMVFISAASGYPIATMPLGVIPEDGRPYGLGIMAQAGREDLMFQFMSAFEDHFPPRVLPSRVHNGRPNLEI
ncbi:amidase signature enzyme [Penicillium verhagenii]|uniref:amidase signature enzyme n=1 Tax=Penicillium verhagenii TaxID=1562060 RepID=UPI002545A3C4|nr:amidase signature enzyme [Penicillium verhagenii]KAJ5919128.1 amidase signature enzyme [Penicillium verhagenii]